MSTCYIVATPIGNLGDMSDRARDILSKVDHIYAEDTRVTGNLLTQFGIRNHLISLHEHNERERIEEITKQLDNKESIAIVSDAGTPLISDPGYPVVATLQQTGYHIVPIPGPSALIAALSVAGLPTDRFTFEGFLPAKSGARIERLKAMRDRRETTVFYESSHRILKMLDDAITVFGSERIAFIGREMTKRFESYRQGKLAAHLNYYHEHSEEVRGEFVVVIEGSDEAESDETILSTDHLLKILLDEQLPVKQIASIAESLTNRSRNELYQRALVLRKMMEEEK